MRTCAKKKGNIQDDIWWLNVYVILSRATKLENLLLLGLTDDTRKLLEAGPPKYIRARLQQLQEKARKAIHDADTVATVMGLRLGD